MGCKNEIDKFWAHKCDCRYFIQILNIQMRIVCTFMVFRCYFMGSNNSGKQVSFQKKIVTDPRVGISSQYKKDNLRLPTQTQLPTNAMRVH
jgi:hypothetical protein